MCLGCLKSAFLSAQGAAQFVCFHLPADGRERRPGRKAASGSTLTHPAVHDLDETGFAFAEVDIPLKTKQNSSRGSRLPP